jgi:ATP-binding cassette, subfamily B, bacterial
MTRLGGAPWRRFIQALDETPLDRRLVGLSLHPGAHRRRRQVPWVTLTDSRASGVEQVVEPVPSLSVRQVFRRFWPFTRPYRGWLAVQIVFVLVGPVADASAIWLFKRLVDEVLAPHDFAPFSGLALQYVVLTLVIGVVSLARRYLATWTGGRFLLDLRTHVYSHIHGLSLDFFERRRLGDTLTRLSGDVAAIEAVVLSGVTSAAGYLLRVLLYGAILIHLQWQMTAIALTIAPLLWAVSRVFSKRLKQASRVNRQQSAALGALAEESLSNALLVQAYGRQENEVQRYQRQGAATLQSQLRSTLLRGLFSPITELLELAGLLLVIGFGTWQLSRGRLTLGELLVFMAYFGQLYSPLRGMAGFANSLSSAAASAERVIELMDQEPAVRSPAAAARMSPLEGFVRLDGVGFTYPGRNSRVLNDIELAADPGQTIALVGGSGAGKSTIFKLLLRYYDPILGAVTLDGHDLRSMDLRRLRASVAVVMQETLVFDATIRENILWGRPDAGKQQFDAAVEAADLPSFLGRLPDGIDTRVGQRGRRLSGGERQRVAIARALLRDAPILLLDEPTTGLDAEAGERVLEPLGRLMRGRTTIVVSHNLLTVKDAHEIVVLEQGRVAERGTHDQLEEAAGPYRRLLELHQAKSRLTGQRSTVGSART